MHTISICATPRWFLQVYSMNDAVGIGEIINSSDIDLDKEEVFSTLEKQKFVTSVDNMNGKHFKIPLRKFSYGGYDSDIFALWYNIVKEIFEDIKGICQEKRLLNLSLSVLMLPYIAISLRSLVYRSRVDDEVQEALLEEKNKIKKSKVSESMLKRLAYSVLAAIAILANIVILVILIIPSTLALSIFYLLNRKLSQSLITTFKVESRYNNENQNVEVYFHEIDAGELDIRWSIEIKFPPKFKQLLKDLCEDKNCKILLTQDAEHNTMLKFLANIHLKNGLSSLSPEIRSILATSVKGFTEGMEEVLKLDKKELIYDKLKGLLNEFRLKTIRSVTPKITSHLIQDAYRVAFIQAIKVAQQRRKKGFSLEKRLREVLVEQELKSQGKELPTEKDIIIKDLKKLKGKEALNLLSDEDIVGDNEFPVLKAVWEQLITDNIIEKRTVINVCRDVYPQATKRAIDNAETEIKSLKELVLKKYNDIYKELKKIYANTRNGNLKDSVIKRKLEDLFKLEYDDQEVERKLIRSVIKRAKGELRQLDILENRKLNINIIRELDDLEKKIDEKTSEEVNDFIDRMYLEITKCRIQSLFKEQVKGIERSCLLLKKDAPDLVAKISFHYKEIEEYLENPQQSTFLLRTIIEKNYDLNKYLRDEKNVKGKDHPNTKLIDQYLRSNQGILKTLGSLESKKEELLINKKTRNYYKEELNSREKIKFSIIEDDLLKIFKRKTFNETRIKKLLEKAELEYYLAGKCIKNPVIKTKDNIKHFCQTLLTPLIDNLVRNIINNMPKNGKSPWRQPRKSLWTAHGYIKTGCVTAIYGNQSTEGRALSTAHDSYNEVKKFLQYFESSYEKVGGLIGNIFTDSGETFKKYIWPKIEDHLLGVLDSFFKDVEFTLINKDELKNVSKKLDNVNIVQSLRILAI